MKICVNPGHTLSGSGSGSVGIKNESVENRKVAKEVIRLLKEQGHDVIESIVDKANSQVEYLKKCTDVANKSNCDLFVSIHFNAFDGRANGTEVLIYNNSSKCKIEANRICENISKLGFKNRGVKERKDLYMLRHTKMPALLVECCFIDSENDMKIYNVGDMARAIVEGIINKNIEKSHDKDKFYRVCVGSFRDKDNAAKVLEEAKDKGYKDAFIISI
jgi:N-acetylmuramoyl-L-alanine amidase